MKKIDQLISQPAEWLRSTGPMNDIVVSSRVRLARNLSGYAFNQKIKPAKREEVIAKVEKAVGKCPQLKGAIYARYNDLTEMDRQILWERHLVSREHATEKGDRAVAFTANEMVSLMVLEEDHLRLQVFRSGFNFMDTWKIVNEIDSQLEKNLDYSFSATLGYLTACPTNLGTGLRASCMLHLPGLVLTKQVQKVLQALSKLNLAVRGLYGEGTQATGNMFQFSNQITLGQREEEIINNLECVIKQVLEHEKQARNFLLQKKKAKFQDQIWRALGSLKSARVISSQEATQLISLVQLGLQSKMIDTDMTVQELNTLFLLVQPAHLQKLASKNLDATERDLRRAELIREKLKNVPL